MHACGYSFRLRLRTVVEVSDTNLVLGWSHSWNSVKSSETSMCSVSKRVWRPIVAQAHIQKPWPGIWRLPASKTQPSSGILLHLTQNAIISGNSFLNWHTCSVCCSGSHSCFKAQLCIPPSGSFQYTQLRCFLPLLNSWYSCYLYWCFRLLILFSCVHAVFLARL
jgi:hypothetical protein